MAAKDGIKEALYALRPLRGKVEKFFQFEKEVRETITLSLIHISSPRDA